MKIIYHSTDLRLVVDKKSGIVGSDIIRLRIQERRKWFIFHNWKSVQEICVQLEKYWNPTRGTKFEMCDHLTLSTSVGPNMEVWWPEDFNLDKRISAFWAEYFDGQKWKLKARKIISTI